MRGSLIKNKRKGKRNAWNSTTVGLTSFSRLDTEIQRYTNAFQFREFYCAN